MRAQSCCCFFCGWRWGGGHYHGDGTTVLNTEFWNFPVLSQSPCSVPLTPARTFFLSKSQWLKLDFKKKKTATKNTLCRQNKATWYNSCSLLTNALPVKTPQPWGPVGFAFEADNHHVAHTDLQICDPPAAQLLGLQVPPPCPARNTSFRWLLA